MSTCRPQRSVGILLCLVLLAVCSLPLSACHDQKVGDRISPILLLSLLCSLEVNGHVGWEILDSIQISVIF